MKKLSKTQEATHAELAANLSKSFDELKSGVVEFNDEVSRIFADLEPKVAAYNAAVVAANEFVQEIHGEQEGFYDEKSEKWQEGDAGNAYQEWMGEWDTELEEIGLEEAPQLDEPEGDYESFENLPLEVSS